MAEQLAKEGSKKQQPNSKLSNQEANTLIRNKRLADFKHINGGYNTQQDTLRLLSRHEQTLIFRLRTGHCGLRSHMKKVGIENSALCPCGLEAQTTAHVLQACPLHKRERKRKHLANRKFPREKTPWNSHRPTPDGAVHRPDGTTHITSLHRTLKKKNCMHSRCGVVLSAPKVCCCLSIC